MQRLNIVVPYRDRIAHLNAFVPLMRAYFARDKIDRNIPYRVLIVEQENGLPFNRGAIKNIGFVLGRGESDYTCFHDIDYLPVWADYSWSDVPACILWYGAETRPIRVNNPGNQIGYNVDFIHGGVVLAPNLMFEQVDGYSNTYWGWGAEDTDLLYRFQAANIAFGRRRGSFQPLLHDHDGYSPDKTFTPDAAANHRLLAERWSVGSTPRADGLSTLKFEILNRRPIPEGPTVERPAIWEIVKVRLKT